MKKKAKSDPIKNGLQARLPPKFIFSHGVYRFRDGVSPIFLYIACLSHLPPDIPDMLAWSKNRAVSVRVARAILPIAFLGTKRPKNVDIFDMGPVTSQPRNQEP